MNNQFFSGQVQGQPGGSPENPKQSEPFPTGLILFLDKRIEKKILHAMIQYFD